MRPRTRPLPPLLFFALLLAVACRTSTPTPEGKLDPYVPLPDEVPPTIGFFLTQFDGWLLRWSDLKLSATSPREQNELQALEVHMAEKAIERRDELLEQLESGAPLNRRIAAAALGFSGDATVLGPLLGALSEGDPELTQKALLGIGVLALAETPAGALREHLVGERDAWTRNNAAFALLAIARAGNRTPELAETCRLALTDPEPGVRAQCASTLGLVADEDSVPALTPLLLDEANLVALASAMSLARIGREHPTRKGTVARTLAGALERVPAARRGQVLEALRWLSGQDLGDDAGPWLEWAHRLP